jgi:hypothetical protein
VPEHTKQELNVLLFNIILQKRLSKRSLHIVQSDDRNNLPQSKRKIWSTKESWSKARRFGNNLSFALQQEVRIRQAQRLCIDIDIIGSQAVSLLRCHSHDV